MELVRCYVVCVVEGPGCFRGRIGGVVVVQCGLVWFRFGGGGAWPDAWTMHEPKLLCNRRRCPTLNQTAHMAPSRRKQRSQAPCRGGGGGEHRGELLH